MIASRREVRQRLVPFAVLVALVSAPAAALAQSGQDASLLAETLFRDGRRLMEAKNYVEGCPKLEESLRLDPAPGTLLALATCHEQQGKVASAWGEFSQSVATARRDGRADRESFAREHIALLEPQLPKVVIDVPAGSRVADLQVMRNGTLLTATAWGAELPSDPGAIVVAASAPGHKPWTFTGSVALKQVLHVSIPPLEDAPAPPPVVAQTVPDASATTSPNPTDEPKPRSDHKVLAYVIGGVGVAALGVGTYFGVHALSKQHDSNAACPVLDGSRACTQAGVDANASALTSAHVADVTIGAGIAAVAVGVVLFALSPHSKESSAAPSTAGSAPRMRLVPSMGRDGGGAALVGTF